MLEIVINCLRLFVVVIYCYHGDGSDGRHVYKVSWPYALLLGYYVGKIVPEAICCCHLLLP